MRQLRLQTRRRQELRQVRRHVRRHPRSMIRIEALSGAPAISAAAVAVVPRLGLAIPACAGVADPATIPLRAAPTKSAPMVEALLAFVDINHSPERDETHHCARCRKPIDATRVAMCCASQEVRKVVVGRSDTSSDWIRWDQSLAFLFEPDFFEKTSLTTSQVRGRRLGIIEVRLLSP